MGKFEEEDEELFSLLLVANGGDCDAELDGVESEEVLPPAPKLLVVTFLLGVTIGEVILLFLPPLPLLVSATTGGVLLSLFSRSKFFLLLSHWRRAVSFMSSCG